MTRRGTRMAHALRLPLPGLRTLCLQLTQGFAEDRGTIRRPRPALGCTGGDTGEGTAA